MDQQGAEAFVEINDPHVAVRMRRLKWADTRTDYSYLKAAYADLLWAIKYTRAETAQETAGRKLRLSTSDTHRAAYFELLNLEDSNAVADKLKAKLKDLGYKLTDERFPV